MKILAVFLLVIGFLCPSCEQKKAEPTIYIISSNSSWTEKAFTFSKKLADSLENDGVKFYFTHESLNKRDILDGEWKGIKNSENLTLVCTDERQTSRDFKKHYESSYSSIFAQQTNIINKYFSDVCKESGIEPVVPLWDTPKADSLQGIVVQRFSTEPIFVEYKDRLNFLNQPNDKVLNLCLASHQEKSSCIVRYDDAHSFWLQKELEKRGIGYKYFYIGNPKDNYGKERKYFLLLMSASWVVGEF